MCSLEVYIKSFGGQKGGSLEPPRTPPAYGPAYQRNECTYKLVFHLSSLNIGFVHYTTLSSCTCVTEHLHYVVLASCLVRKNEFFKKCIHTYSAVALLGLARIEAKGGKMRDTE